MLTLIGLMAAAVALGLVVLPFWSLARVTRLTRELAELRARLSTLEHQQAGGSPVAALDPAPAFEASTDAELQTPPSLPHVSAPIDTAAPGDLESRVGGRWLLYVGIAILLVGVSFFLKYAFDNAWITETGRVLLGALGGLGLVRAGWRTARRLPAFGLALTGTGIATLYLCIWAAHAFYALVGAGAAFALMAGTTLLATALADRSSAQSLALLAAIGGYVTPFLLQNAAPGASPLFSYDLVLGAGALVLTRRHQWLALPALAYVLTVVTVAAWASDHYTSGQWVVVLTFLTAFCALFVEMLRYVRRLEGSDATVIAALLWSAPAVYHAAAIAITIGHPPALHVYLILFTVASLLLTAGRESGWLRLLTLVAAYAPLFGYLDSPRGPSWLWPNVVTALAIGGMHLMSMVDRALGRSRPLATGDLLVMHAAVIGLYGLLAEILRSRSPDGPADVAAGLAVLGAGLWFVFKQRDQLAALNAAGLSFTLVAIAVATQFDGRVVVVGWAVEGAAVAWIGVKASSSVFRFGGLTLWALAAARLVDGYAADPAGLAVLNARTAATAVVIVFGYLLARQWRHHEVLRQSERVVPLALHIAASGFTMLWMSAEIDAFWRSGRGQPNAELSNELMRSLAWGGYGAALVAAGMWRSLVSIRWIGISVIGLTVLKVVFVDLSELAGIYRVVGFMVVGALLVGVSYLYQRTREAGPAGKAAAYNEPPPRDHAP